MKKIIITLLCGCLCGPILAQHKAFGRIVFRARVAFMLGGTAPINMPASIRGLNKFDVQPNLLLGCDAITELDDTWSASLGLYIEDKDMSEDAHVKNYRMAMTKGGETIKGVFSGDVTTNVKERMLTLPVQLYYTPSKWVSIKVGPYISYLLTKSFTGYAHNGYLRKNDPTGPKIILGDTPNTRGSYDFSDDLRHFQWGLNLGADFRLTRHWGLFADVSWGLSGIHKRDFKTIEQTLYPIYGKLGVSYNL